MNITEESILEKSISLTTTNKLDNLFPIVKTLGTDLFLKILLKIF